MTPNTSKEDLEKAEDEDPKKEPEDETGITMVNGGDTGNGIPLRAGERDFVTSSTFLSLGS